MSLHLYEITAQMAAIDAAIDAYAVEHEGEIPDNLDAQLAALQLQRNEKLLSIGRWIKNLEGEAEAVAAEKERLAARQSALENKAARLRAWVAQNLFVGEKLSDANVAYSWRKSTSVEITDINQIPAAYLHVEETASKADIKKVLVSGIDVPGAALVEKMNLQLK